MVLNRELLCEHDMNSRLSVVYEFRGDPVSQATDVLACQMILGIIRASELASLSLILLHRSAGHQHLSLFDGVCFDLRSPGSHKIFVYRPHFIFLTSRAQTRGSADLRDVA